MVLGSREGELSLGGESSLPSFSISHDRAGGAVSQEEKSVSREKVGRYLRTGLPVGRSKCPHGLSARLQVHRLRRAQGCWLDAPLCARDYQVVVTLNELFRTSLVSCV